MSQLISPPFGNGSDGVWSTSGNATDAPIDSSCSGTSGATSLTATNVSFATGQLILIHQTRGTGVGQWELNKISSYVAGTITTLLPLAYTYTDSGSSQAQVLVVKQYSSIAINTGHTISVKDWDQNVGGILAMACSGITTVTGTLDGGGTDATASGIAGKTGGGFLGGNGLAQSGSVYYAYCGEGTSGASALQQSANGNAGGGGRRDSGDSASAGGGGGGNGTAGEVGGAETGTTGGAAGTTSGSADLTTMTFGGGGGGRIINSGDYNGGASGGGIILIYSKELVVTGGINADGGAPSTGGGGGGAGGSILIKTQKATLGSGLVSAVGAVSAGSGVGYWGGGSGTGRIRVEYQTLSGTTNPSASTVYKYFGVDHAGMI